MARSGVAYPQVEPGVAAMMHRRVAVCPPDATVSGAARLADRMGAEAVLLGRRVLRPASLARAREWGFGAMPAAAVAGPMLPTLPATASEVAARRVLIGGAPAVLVVDRGRIVGVVEGRGVPRPALSLAHRLEQPGNASREARLRLLRLAGKVGEALGTPAYAVGGFVRDALLGRPALDVDLVVVGDGVAFADRLALEVGGRLTVHAGFGTASIEMTQPFDGAVLGRVDVATARRERYEAPGALPRVSAAPLAEDLERRDFSVNAMAIALDPAAFGRLVDPVGGAQDLARRRLRVLHPLSFVEDPTRIFRAARYAARLGFRLDADGRRALRLALAVRAYPALSGQRLAAEVARIAGEATGWRACGLLVGWGALGLWHPGYRSGPAGRARLHAARRLAEAVGLDAVGLDPASAALLALLVDQRAPVVHGSLARLAITGGRARELAAAGVEGRRLARRLRRPRCRTSAVAEALAGATAPALAAAWLLGGRLVRRRLEWFVRAGRRVKPQLTGEDVMALGIARGPDIGRALAALRRARLDGTVVTRDEECRYLRQWRLAGKGDRR
jgi:tRNA nucleotidyltransferase (CCA-adding enzyme)